MEPHAAPSLAARLSAHLFSRSTPSGLDGCGLALGAASSRPGRAASPGHAATQSRQGNSPSDVPPWRLVGDAMEACRCAVTCPCNFTSDPTEIPCHAIVGWHIVEGHYGDTRLDDVNLVAYVLIPGNAFAGDWTLGFYIDERATAPQMEALGAIFGGQAGGWPAALAALIGTPIPPKRAPITYRLADGEVQVSIPGILEIGTEPVPHPMPGMPPLDLQVSNLAVPFYTGTTRVRRSTMLRLTDPDLSFEYLGRSALIGTFVYEGP